MFLIILVAYVWILITLHLRCHIENPSIEVDRASVPSPIAIEILMVHNGEGQSSHVLVFCVNLELLEIILFTLKSNYYVYIAVLSLQYICC